jgi:hypothetical protein
VTARAFILIDAVPNRENDVYESVLKFPGVVAARRLKQRVGQGDVLALVEAPTQEELERIISSRMRSLTWVHAIIRIMPHHTMMGPVYGLMEEMYKEADRRKPT